MTIQTKHSPIKYVHWRLIFFFKKTRILLAYVANLIKCSKLSRITYMLQTLLWAASEIVPEESRKSRLPNIYRLELALPRTRVKVMLTRENESSPTSLSSVNREIMSYDWVKINESMQRNIPLQIWDSKDNDFFFKKKTMICWKQSFNHNIVSGKHAGSWSHMIWKREIKNYLRSLVIFVLF